VSIACYIEGGGTITTSTSIPTHPS